MPEIEEIDDIPDLEPQEGSTEQDAVAAAAAAGIDPALLAQAQQAMAARDDKIQNRNEKKARKAVQKLGLRPVGGILQVSVKKGKSTLFVVKRPDVYKSPEAETYVFFGEPQNEDSGAAASQAAAAKQFQAQAAAAQAAAAAQQAPSETEEEVDESGLEPKDIELVMSQAGVSRSVAVKAMRENDGDLVNSIMSLTK